MSTNLNYKQKVNVERRTWDLEVYEKKAKERENKGSKKKSSKKTADPEVGEKRSLDQVVVPEEDAIQEEFVPAAKGAAGPQLSKRAFLKARKRKVDVIDSKVGTVEMINPEAAATSKAFGEDGASPSVRIKNPGGMIHYDMLVLTHVCIVLHCVQQSSYRMEWSKLESVGIARFAIAF